MNPTLARTISIAVDASTTRSAWSSANSALSGAWLATTVSRGSRVAIRNATAKMSAE